MTAQQFVLNPKASERESSATEQLVNRVTAGDRDAFAELYRIYSPMVHGIILSRVRVDEVDDIVQDVFVSAFEKIGTLRDRAAVGGWLAMIARHRAIEFFRSERETEELTDDIHDRDRFDTQGREALRAIRELPESYRETLILRLVEGLTGPEIAEQTGLKPESVRVNLHRGMKMLREKMGHAEKKK